MTDAMTQLTSEKYVNLITFRRNGTPVRTPVWFAVVEGDKLGIFTNVGSYKVKRLRRDPRVQVAACNARGKVHGRWHEGRAELIDDPQRSAAVYEALSEKYGVLWTVTKLAGKISGRERQWQTLIATLEGPVVTA